MVRAHAALQIGAPQLRALPALRAQGSAPDQGALAVPGLASLGEPLREALEGQQAQEDTGTLVSV